MTEPQATSVEVRRNRTDYLKFMRILRGAQNIQTYSLIAWMTAGVFVGTLHEWLSDLPYVQKHIFYNYGGFYLAGMVLLFFIATNFIYRIIGRNIQYVGRNLNFMRPQTYEINATGIKDTSETGYSFMSWNGVTNILRTREYLLFYVDTMTAHIIPVRNFASAQAADTFYKNARAFWTQAKQSKAG